MRTTIIVSGFPRCGSSLTMQLLRAGGLPVTGEGPLFETAEAVTGLNPWPPAWRGCAVKVLAPYAAARLPQRMADTVILWLHRNPIEQAQSSVKMGVACGISLDTHTLATTYATKTALEIFHLARVAPVVHFDFATLLGHVAAMRDVAVDRPSAPQPDLAIELGLTARYGWPTACLCGAAFTNESPPQQVFRICGACVRRLAEAA
jgi:hypothetical protein